MSSWNRTSPATHLLTVVAAAGVMGLSGLMAPSGLLGNDDGPDIPSVGDSKSNCTVSSSDPRNRDSCNSSGHNGSDGAPGSVHGHPDDWTHHESVNERIHEREAREARPGQN